MFEHRSLLAFVRELAMKWKQFWAKVTPNVVPYPLKPWSGSLRGMNLSTKTLRLSLERHLHPGLEYYGCTVGVAVVNA